MKKKNKKMMIWIIGIVITLLVLNYIGLFKIGNSLTLVPIDCKIGEYCHESASTTYICPLGIPQCNIKGVAECNIRGTEPNVVFRTNAKVSDDYDSKINTWFMLYGTGYCYTSTKTSYIDTRRTFTTPTGDPIQFYNYQYAVKTSDAQARIYKPCSSQELIDFGVDLTRTPVEPFTTQNCGGKRPCQELVDGSSYSYNCPNQKFEVYASQSDYDLKKTPLYYHPDFKYQDDEPGNKSKTYELLSGQLVSVTGGDKNHIYYSELHDVETCTKSVCNQLKTGYYNCKNGIVDRTKLFDCDTDGGYACEPTIGNCTFSFTEKDIRIADKFNQIKPAYNTDEQIAIFSKIRSERISSGDVEFQIYDLNNPNQYLINYKLENYNFKSTTYTSQEIDMSYTNLPGNYFVKTFVILPNKLPILIGSYDFKVSEKILSSVNIRATEAGLSKIFVNQPFYVEINVLDTKEPPQEATMINLTLTLNGIPIQLPPNFEDIVSGTTRTYRYTMTSLQPGQLIATGSLTSRGGAISPRTSITSSVENVEIKTDYLDLPVGCVEPGPVTIHFETKDSYNNYVDTTNTLKLTDTAGIHDISNLVQPDISTGKYKFTYTFGIDAYSLELISTSTLYGKSSQPRSGSFEGKSPCVQAECYQNSQCTIKHGPGWICRSGTCEDTNSPWLIYLLVGVIILVIIIVIVLIIKYSKNKSSPSIGIGGL